MTTLDEPTPIPALKRPQTRDHDDCRADMPADPPTELGPLTAGAKRALLSVGVVASVPHARWGDGSARFHSAHFHQWFLPRPLDPSQLPGSVPAVSLDVLPPVPEQQLQVTVARPAAAMRQAATAGPGR
jgi:hypothetical protein